MKGSLLGTVCFSTGGSLPCTSIPPVTERATDDWTRPFAASELSAPTRNPRILAALHLHHSPRRSQWLQPRRRRPRGGANRTGPAWPRDRTTESDMKRRRRALCIGREESRQEGRQFPQARREASRSLKWKGGRRRGSPPALLVWGAFRRVSPIEFSTSRTSRRAHGDRSVSPGSSLRWRLLSTS